jgi:excisionase family DNA binding protein
MPTTTAEPMLTTREVAQRLNLSEDAVRRLIRQKRIKASDISKTGRVIYRVAASVVEDYLEPAA